MVCDLKTVSLYYKIRESVDSLNHWSIFSDTSISYFINTVKNNKLPVTENILQNVTLSTSLNYSVKVVNFFQMYKSNMLKEIFLFLTYYICIFHFKTLLLHYN